MINNFLKPGLQDLCVSRTSFKWGIPVDFDPKHVVYVWLDALTNYITGIGYDADGNSKDSFKKYWPADVHIIGKDIVRFHTIYWPIFLMALGLPLPKQVYGHGWLLQDGGKMSKSKGNVIYADDLVEYFGSDAVRYYVLSEMTQGSDGTISWEAVVDKINGELANVFGNLVSRTVAMSNKYFGGVIENANVNEPVDDDLKEVVTSAYGKVAENMDEYKISDAINEVMTVFRRANKYVDETTPWILAKDPSKEGRLKTVLYNLSEAIIVGTSLMYPFMPKTCQKALSYFGSDVRDYDKLNTFGLLETVKAAESPEILFTRLDLKEIMEKVNKMIEERKAAAEKEAAKTAPEATEENKKELIPIDDFFKVELKVALVTACEVVPKSNKLLKLTVKLGNETRTVVSGIRKAYSPEYLIGKKVVMVTNLKPAKLCGIESQGMIICAENSEGKIAFLSPETDMEDGSVIS